MLGFGKTQPTIHFYSALATAAAVVLAGTVPGYTERAKSGCVLVINSTEAQTYTVKFPRETSTYWTVAPWQAGLLKTANGNQLIATETSTLEVSVGGRSVSLPLNKWVSGIRWVHDYDTEDSGIISRYGKCEDSTTNGFWVVRF